MKRIHTSRLSAMLFDLLTEKHGRSSYTSQYSLYIVLFAKIKSPIQSFGLHLVVTISKVLLHSSFVIHRFYNLSHFFIASSLFQ